MASQRCPKCRKLTLRDGVQTTLDGEEIPFVYCCNSNCDYQEPPLKMKFGKVSKARREGR